MKDPFRELYDHCQKTVVLFDIVFSHAPVVDMVKEQIADACKLLIFASSLALHNHEKIGKCEK